MAGETILVVDDSPTIRKVVAYNLERAGYFVTTATDGQDGLEVAQKVNPQLIFLDFVMPRMNGFQFCVALREITHLAQVPVVLMSAKGDKIGDKFIQQMGAVDFITKPFSPDALLAVSSHVLAQYFEDGDDPTARIDKLDPLQSTEESKFEPTGDHKETGDTSRRCDKLSLAESQLACEVADQLAARVANILTTTIPQLAKLGDEIEEVLAQRLTPKALETISQTIAQLKPFNGESAFAGVIAEVPLAEVFQLLQHQQQTGCFEIRRDRFRVMVSFRNGSIALVQALGGRSEFLLGRYMVENEVIGRRELELLLRNRTDENNELLGQQLVKCGHLSEKELSLLLERQSSELVYEVLRWRRGRYDFRPSIFSREAELAGLEISVDSLLLEGFRRVNEWRLIEQKIEDCDVVFLRDVSAIDRFGREKLTHEEQCVLGAIDGRRSLRQIIDFTQMGSFLVCKLIYRLFSIKLIRKRSV